MSMENVFYDDNQNKLYLLPEPNQQNNTKQLGWCELIIGKITHHHTGFHYNSGSSRQPRKLISGMQPYVNPTRWIMEDDLNIFENGRQPQFL